MKLSWVPQAIQSASKLRDKPKPLQFGLNRDTYFRKRDYYNVIDSSLSKHELDTVLERLETLKAASILGRGLHGVTYKVPLSGSKRRVVVIKIGTINKNTRKPGNMITEARLLPRYSRYNRAGRQKLLAHIQRNNQDILVTTFVKGSNPNFQSNPLTPKMLLTMMKEMLFWEQKGVLHYDNHFGNWLVSENGKLAFLIDFEWGEMLAERMRDGTLTRYPSQGRTREPFGIWSTIDNQKISNLDIFETHAIFGSYFFDNIRQGLKNHQTLITDQEMRRVFKMYLQAAAYFHKHRRPVDPDFTCNSIMINGVEAQAHLLEDPDPLILMVEAMRIQAPFEDERDFHATIIHEGSMEEHIRWRWNAYQHAGRYNSTVGSLLDEALDYRHTLVMVPWNERNYQLLRKQEEKIQYLYYHLAISLTQLEKTSSKLTRLIAQYTSQDTLSEPIRALLEIRNVETLLSQLNIPREPEKPFDNPDDYDIAARIIGAVNQGFGKIPAISAFHKV